MFWINYCPNTGDYFGKWLLEKMRFRVKFSNTPDIVIWGSILGANNFIQRNTKILGAGFHFDEEFNAIKNRNLSYEVRGKSTLKKLNFSSNIVLGDPGLLLSKYFKPITKKQYDICIISHFQDNEYFNQNYKFKYFIINMATNNIEKLGNSLNKCKFIFSISLHGIIFYHSLGIPAIHLEYKELLSKKNFKFNDYKILFRTV